MAQFLLVEKVFPSKVKYWEENILISLFSNPMPESIAGNIVVWNGIFSLPWTKYILLSSLFQYSSKDCPFSSITFLDAVT